MSGTFSSENNDNEIIAIRLFFNPSLSTAQKFFSFLAVGCTGKEMEGGWGGGRLQNIKLCHFTCTWRLNQRGKLMRPAAPCRAVPGLDGRRKEVGDETEALFFIFSSLFIFTTDGPF